MLKPAPEQKEHHSPVEMTEHGSVSETSTEAQSVMSPLPKIVPRCQSCAPAGDYKACSKFATPLFPPGVSLRSPTIFFWLRTAFKESPRGPPGKY